MRWRLLFNFGLRGFSTLLVGSSPWLLGRWLGAEVYGTYAYFYSVSWVTASAIVVGLDLLVMREAAGTNSTADKEKIRGLFFWSHGLLACVNLGMWGIALYLSHILQGQFEAILPSSMRLILRYWWLLAMAVTLISLMKLWEGLLIGMGHFVQAQLPRLVTFPVGMLAGTFFISRIIPQWNRTEILLLFEGVLFFPFLMLLLFVVKQGWPYWLEFRFNASVMRAELPRWWKSLVPFALAGLLSIIDERIGVILIGSMVGVSGAGIFDVAAQSARLAAFPLVVTHAVVAPKFASLHNCWRQQKDEQAHHQLQHLVKQVSRMTAVGGVLMSAGLWIAAPWAFRFLGQEFSGGLLILGVLLLGQLFNALVGPVALLLNMTGNERSTMFGMILALLVNVGFGIIAIKVYGLLGMALARTTSLVVWNIYMVRQVVYRLRIKPLPWGKL